ncbi:MAG: hypothetical protein NW200_08620 [Hyphomonadaceae bacterium]|nr:hypothetical protein [Hyphomonadaceae bacterium]
MQTLRFAAAACALLLSPVLAGAGAFAESAAPRADAGKGATRLSSAVSYVPLTPLTAATPAGRSIGGMIAVDFGLDIPDAKLRNRAIAMRPRLMDALRATVADYALTRVRPGAPPDPDQLSALAQAAMDRTMGGPGVKVLITNVMITERR